jgi:hypothetical protein
MSDETALWLHNFKQLMFFVEVAKDNFQAAPNSSMDKLRLLAVVGRQPLGTQDDGSTATSRGNLID